MQIWTTYYQGEIEKALSLLSKEKMKPAIVVTTTDGNVIASEKYDAVASKDFSGNIHAFLRIGKIFYGERGYFYDLEHTQLYPEDIKEIAICNHWVSESDSPEDVLKPGMKVKFSRVDTDELFEGELTIVTFLDIVVKTAEKEVSVPVSKISSITIL